MDVFEYIKAVVEAPAKQAARHALYAANEAARDVVQKLSGGPMYGDLFNLGEPDAETAKVLAELETIARNNLEARARLKLSELLLAK